MSKLETTSFCKKLHCISKKTRRYAVWKQFQSGALQCDNRILEDLPHLIVFAAVQEMSGHVHGQDVVQQTLVVFPQLPHVLHFLLGLQAPQEVQSGCGLPLGKKGETLQLSSPGNNLAWGNVGRCSNYLPSIVEDSDDEHGHEQDGNPFSSGVVRPVRT